MRWQTIPAWPLLICLTIGILSYNFFNSTLLGYTFHLALCILSFITTIYICRPKRNVFKSIFVLRDCCVLCGFYGIGFISSYHTDIHNNNYFYGKNIDSATYFVVQLQSTPIPKNKTFLLEGNVIQSILPHTHSESSGKIQLYIYKDSLVHKLKGNEILIIPNKLSKIHWNKNPYSFNFERYASYQNLYYQSFLSIKELQIIDRKEALSSLQQHRKFFLNILDKNILDSTTASITKAMLLNERNTLQDDIWKIYASTGVVHIISISGMHTQIFLWIILFMLSFIKHKKYNWIKYVIASILVWYYIAITQYPPSAVRAAIMFSITSLAIILQKEENHINSLGVAGLIMLLVNPNWIYHLGMQLSFLCMLSIYIFYKPVVNLIYLKNPILRKLWEGVALSIAVQYLVAPIAIYYFHQFPLFVVLANIPASIYASILMIGALIIFLLGAFINVSFIGEVLHFCTYGFHKIIGTLAEATPSFLSQFGLDVLDTILLSMALLTTALGIFIYKNKRWIISGSMLLAVFLVSVLFQKFNSLNQEKLIIYQANQHSLIQIVKSNTSYIYTDFEHQIAHDKYLLSPKLHWNIKLQDIALPQNAIIKLNRYKVAILDNVIPEKTTIDIIILTSTFDKNIDTLYKTLQPKIIILDSSFPRWKAQKIKNTYFDISIHAVSIDGAFMLEF
jgi:competence protein ComEC